MKLFQPRRTLGSVIQTLHVGLGDGSIFLDESELLANLAANVATLLRNQEVDAGLAADILLSNFGTVALKALIASFKDGDDSVRRRVAGILTAIGAPAVEPLSGALTDDDNGVRFWAVATLGKIRDERAVEALIVALGDKDDSVRKRAAHALGRIGDARAVDPLSGAAMNDNDRSVRQFAAYALGQIRDALAVDRLIGALKDENAIVRSRAAEALGFIGEV